MDLVQSTGLAVGILFCHAVVGTHNGRWAAWEVFKLQYTYVSFVLSIFALLVPGHWTRAIHQRFYPRQAKPDSPARRRRAKARPQSLPPPASPTTDSDPLSPRPNSALGIAQGVPAILDKVVSATGTRNVTEEVIERIRCPAKFCGHTTPPSPTPTPTPVDTPLSSASASSPISAHALTTALKKVSSPFSGLQRLRRQSKDAACGVKCSEVATKVSSTASGKSNPAPVPSLGSTGKKVESSASAPTSATSSLKKKDATKVNKGSAVHWPTMNNDNASPTASRNVLQGIRHSLHLTRSNSSSTSSEATTAEVSPTPTPQAELKQDPLAKQQRQANKPRLSRLLSLRDNKKANIDVAPRAPSGPTRSASFRSSASAFFTPTFRRASSQSMSEPSTVSTSAKENAAPAVSASASRPAQRKSVSYIAPLKVQRVEKSSATTLAVNTSVGKASLDISKAKDAIPANARHVERPSLSVVTVCAQVQVA